MIICVARSGVVPTASTLVRIPTQATMRAQRIIGFLSCLPTSQRGRGFLSPVMFEAKTKTCSIFFLNNKWKSVFYWYNLKARSQRQFLLRFWRKMAANSQWNLNMFKTTAISWRHEFKKIAVKSPAVTRAILRRSEIAAKVAPHENRNKNRPCELIIFPIHLLFNQTSTARCSGEPTKITRNILCNGSTMHK